MFRIYFQSNILENHYYTIINFVFLKLIPTYLAPSSKCNILMKVPVHIVYTKSFHILFSF